MSAEEAQQGQAAGVSDANKPDDKPSDAAAAAAASASQKSANKSADGKKEGKTKTTVTNNPYASASLYVGDLGKETTEANLFDIFMTVGPVASIRVCRDQLTHESLGYAYVNFHGVADAERALATMNYTKIRGKQCRIMWSQRSPALRISGKGNIFVKNLHSSIDNKDLNDTFSVFGSILSCKVAVDEQGASRGYGYVHFVDEASAAKAIENVNGMKISEKQVTVEYFKPRSYREKAVSFTNVYVRNIPAGMGVEKLVALFEDEVQLENERGRISSYCMNEHKAGWWACLNWDPERNGASYAAAAVEKMNGFALDTSTFEAWKGDSEAKQDEDDAKQEKEQERWTKLFVTRAQKKVERKNNFEFEGRTGRAAMRNTGSNLYVKNLPPDMDDEKLHAMFAPYGEILSAKVMMTEDGRSREFGFVSFKDKADASKAMVQVANNRNQFGKPLYVHHAMKKETRERYMQKQMRYKRRTQPYYVQRPQQQYPQAFAPVMPAAAMAAAAAGRAPYGGMPPPPVVPQQGNAGAAGGAAAAAAAAAAGRPMLSFPFGMQGAAPFGMQPFAGLNPLQPFSQVNPFNPMLSQQMQGMTTSMQQQQQQAAAAMSRQKLIQQGATGAAGNAGAAGVAAAQAQAQRVAGGQSAQTGAAAVSAATGAQRQSSGAQGSLSQQQMGSATQFRIGQGSQPTATSVPQQQPQQASVSAVSTGHVGTSASMMEAQPLTVNQLQSAKPVERKRLIGERLFPKIQVVEPRLAGKITGMLLEMDNYELLILLGDQLALMNKINEALAVLKDHQQRHSQSNAASAQNSQQNASAANRSSNKNLSNKNR